jgi:hypothetical protein
MGQKTITLVCRDCDTRISRQLDLPEKVEVLAEQSFCCTPCTRQCKRSRNRQKILSSKPTKSVAPVPLPDWSESAPDNTTTLVRAPTDLKEKWDNILDSYGLSELENSKAGGFLSGGIYHFTTDFTRALRDEDQNEIELEEAIPGYALRELVGPDAGTIENSLLRFTTAHLPNPWGGSARLTPDRSPINPFINMTALMEREGEWKSSRLWKRHLDIPTLEQIYARQSRLRLVEAGYMPGRQTSKMKAHDLRASCTPSVVEKSLDCRSARRSHRKMQGDYREGKSFLAVFVPRRVPVKKYKREIKDPFKDCPVLSTLGYERRTDYDSPRYEKSKFKVRHPAITICPQKFKDGEENKKSMSKCVNKAKTGELGLYFYKFDGGFVRQMDEPPSAVMEGMTWGKNLEHPFWIEKEVKQREKENIRLVAA